MSEQTNQQTVVDDATVSAGQDTAAGGARQDDDLDALLSQYDGGKKPEASANQKPEQKAGEGGDEIKVLAEQVRGFISEQQQLTFRRDMDDTIKKVRGDLPAEIFDDKIVEAWMDAQARDDPRLAKAWSERHANPKQFQKVVDTLGRSFVKKYGKFPDRAATEDREAVTAAVRGASTKAPEGKAPDFKQMSDAEYRESVRKEYGFTPL